MSYVTSSQYRIAIQYIVVWYFNFLFAEKRMFVSSILLTGVHIPFLSNRDHSVVLYSLELPGHSGLK